MRRGLRVASEITWLAVLAILALALVLLAVSVPATAVARVLGFTGPVAPFVVLLGAAMLAIGWYVFIIRPRRPREQGFDYVWVSEDGSWARELSMSEQAYLHEEFNGADGARPYIKLRYESKTPTGSLRGYLLRRRLPGHITIKPAESGPVAPAQQRYRADGQKVD